jgi:glycosyltransferase involved in cell wall biosynthesis
LSYFKNTVGSEGQPTLESSEFGVPTLSVIIPAYNRERTISATIDSVLACGNPAEIIVVDDGSNDRTVEVVRGYGTKVILIQQPNAGPAAARNTGFVHSSGDLIAFLDSDDVWLPDVIADCLYEISIHPEIDVLFCETLFGNEKNGYRKLGSVSVSGYGWLEPLLTNSLGPHLFALDRTAFVSAMIHRNQVFLGSALFRRETLNSGGTFDEELFGGEDYELCLRYAATHRFAFYSRPLARYEKHEGGLSANIERMAREFALAVLKFSASLAITPRERREAFAKYRALAFGYGYRAYERGDYREARVRFASAIRNGGFAHRSAVFWLACLLPGPVLRTFRRIWQGLHR